MTDRQVPPYPDQPQERVELLLRTYEYRHPFNYPNIRVERRYRGGESHGLEMNPINTRSPDPEHLPADRIVITEELPIVRVAVIGSACTPPGYVTLEAEPVDGFRREDELEEVMPVRFRADGLWGMHLRADQWLEPNPGGRPVPGREGASFRCTGREFPLAGMSCAVFEVPMSRKVVISGGSAVPGWTTDNFPDDAHYSFRIIRVTVAEARPG
ncbi:MAG TPA: hypothetical protein EYP61_00730 [Candidatus Latescibacteria bacterium]|nr:hypothetical protein [Candidatus Latescibacterota bacterium]